MSDPNRVTVHLEAGTVPGRFTALEGGGGLVRLRLDEGDLRAGDEVGIEMHDGGAFVFAVLEELGEGEYRLKLARRGLS